MVSLLCFGLEETFTEQPSNHIRTKSVGLQDNEKPTNTRQHYRDFCGDCNSSDCLHKTISSRNSKNKKDKHYQPFAVSPWRKDTDEFLARQQNSIPRNHLYLTKSKDVQSNPKQSLKQKGGNSSQFIVKTSEMREFFKLSDDLVIQDFLKTDSCKRIADKYLIAMVFAYFKRADFSLREYTRINFFICLYLAHDVEEDEEEIKYEIFPWVLGEKWRSKYSEFLKRRDVLLKRIEYKAIISRRCCDEIMAIEPQHVLWNRERPLHHSGALRNYMKDPDDTGFPRGPRVGPRPCTECGAPGSEYDSASPASTSWYISSRGSSQDDDEQRKTVSQRDRNEDVWPSVEE